MPDIRPFRALRYDPSTIADLALVVAPPYDVIDAAEEARLLDRHPANVVRLDLPAEQPGDEDDDRYRRAARTLAAVALRRHLPQGSAPVDLRLRAGYRVPGTDVTRTQRGFFGRLRLHAFVTEPVLPHERTMSGPRRIATSFCGRPASTRARSSASTTIRPARHAVLDAVTARAADVDLTDDDGVRHRLWAIAADGDARRPSHRCSTPPRGTGDHRGRPSSLRDRAALSR